MTKKSPSKMQFRLPRGMPITETVRAQTAAARVYADAIMGITYAPVGYY
jgi:hypothetical protein